MALFMTVVAAGGDVREGCMAKFLGFGGGLPSDAVMQTGITDIEQLSDDGIS